MFTSSILANKSTSDTKLPSNETLAMPLRPLRYPIHVADVPLKVKAICAPGRTDSTAVPLLHANQLGFDWLQPALWIIDGSVSSYRTVAAGGCAEFETTTVTRSVVYYASNASHA